MRFSDIQIGDEATWKNLQKSWEDGNYDAVTSVELNKKKTNAKILNDLTDNIKENQKDILDGAASVKPDKIPCQSNQPTQTSGEVWFEVR